MKAIIFTFLFFSAVFALHAFHDKDLQKLMDSYLTVIGVTEEHAPLMKCLNKSMTKTWNSVSGRMKDIKWNSTRSITARFATFVKAQMTTLSGMIQCTKQETIKGIVEKVNTKLKDKSWMGEHVKTNQAALQEGIKNYIVSWGSADYRACGNVSSNITNWFFLKTAVLDQ